MKKLKKFLKIILVASLFIFESNAVNSLAFFAKTEDKLELEEAFVDQEMREKNKSSQISMFSMNEIVSEEEQAKVLAEIEENKRKIDEQEEQKDISVGTILANLLDDDTYIDLATSFEKIDRIKVMHLIVDNIDSFNIKAEQKQELHSYVLSYGPYADDAELLRYVDVNKRKDYTASVINQLSLMYIGGYRHLDAAYFALDNAEGARGKYEPQYDYDGPYPNLADMGGDCTNFVSISLSQGGLREHGDWYLKYKRHKGEYRDFRPSNTNEFNYWYTAGAPSPWISAPKFEQKFSGAFPNIKVNAHTYYSDYNTRKVLFAMTLYRGDVIQVLEPDHWWKRAYHTMMITGYEPEEASFRVSYHSSDRRNISLQNYFLRNWKEGDIKDTELRFYQIPERGTWFTHG